MSCSSLIGRGPGGNQRRLQFWKPADALRSRPAAHSEHRRLHPLRISLLHSAACGQWFCPGVLRAPAGSGQRPAGTGSNSNRSAAAVSTTSPACPEPTHPHVQRPRSTIPLVNLINGPRRQGPRSRLQLCRRLVAANNRPNAAIRARQLNRHQELSTHNLPALAGRSRPALPALGCAHGSEVLGCPRQGAVGYLSVCSAAARLALHNEFF